MSFGFGKKNPSEVNLEKGFTLIELIIVMAIIGVLAVVVFTAVNPTERQAQARDTGRITTVAQIGRAIQGYYAQRGGYPDTASWAQDVLDIGELASFPAGVNYVAYSVVACTTFVQPALNPTYCYNLDVTNGALVFAKAEAISDNSKCTSPEVAYYVYSTADSHGGTICSDGDPTPWVGGTQTYID